MIYRDDLDWLARNVHEWEDGKIECIPMQPYKVCNVVWSSSSPCEGWITKDQWLARRAELQNKPSWADAPESAEWLIQHPSGIWVFGRGDVGECTSDAVWLSVGPCGKVGEVLGDWHDTLERRPADLSEAAVTELLGEDTQNVLAAVPGLMDEKYLFDRNNWHERGELPPVGTECVIWSEGRFPPAECKIVAYSMEQVCVRWNGSGDLDVIDLQFKNPSECRFRPIRTERDVLIEVIKNAPADAANLAASILAAGFKREGCKS